MRTQNRVFRLTTAVTASTLALAQMRPLPAGAQGAPPPPPLGAPYQQAAGDPPARVGRLAQISGTVSYHSQDDTQWSPAALNYPVTAGNAFWTQPNAQAEIEVAASRIAMAPATELDITALDDTTFQASVPQGETYLRIQAAASGGAYAVQTPRGLVALAAPGRYGIAAGDTQTPTTVTVIDGSAQITGPGLSLQVGPNQAATITGTDTFQGQVGPAQPDPYLAAILNRDQPPQQAAAVPAVVAAMPGGGDLSQYGSWSDSPDYGQVWYPQVASGWAPYSDGSWSYVAPWGWTWVDSDPWGFAPFHYGRWAQFGGRWGWVPGGESVYAPAMVAFFGVGAAVGVGIGATLAAGRIGWVPLGPHEAYHPWYHASDRYLQRVNTGRGIDPAGANRNLPISSFANRGAALVVPAGVMTASRPVRGVAQQVDPAQLAQARPVVGQQPLRPTTTTAGVTPAVARQLNLAPAGAVVPHAVAPGPAIRPAGLVPGAVGATAVARPGLPPLHNPTGPGAAAPVAARPLTEQPSLATPGARPGTASPGATTGGAATGGAATGLPALRAPVVPGHAGPPPIEHGPGVAAPAVEPRTGPLASPGVPGHAGPTPIEHGPGVATPAVEPRAGPLASPGVPGHAGPPPIEHGPGVATPAVEPRTGPLASPGVPARPAPELARPAAIAPSAIHPAEPAPVVHAAPVAPAPAPVVHAAPVAPAPAPVVHAAPPPAPVVHEAPPPAPVVHAAPPPAPVVHAAPPPPPVVHAAPPPPAPVVHAAPPPAPVARAAPAPAPQREKKPGEP